jgi:hypothetical protein
MNVRRTGRTGAAARRISPRIVAGSLFAGAIVVIAACAAWPIYRSPAFLLMTGVSVAVAAVIAAVSWRRRWRALLTGAVLAGAFLVLGVPLAVPSRLGGPLDILRGLADLLAGAIVGWKDLLTVDLPVGSYRNLLVPAFVVFLVGTCLLLLLAWRGDRRACAAPVVAIAMVSYGLLFGRTDVSDPLPVGPFTLYAPAETALGLAALLACLVWLAWRTHDERVRSLVSAAESSGVRASRRPSPADRRRVALGAGMVAGAMVIAVAVVPFAARGAEREVLRSSTGPEIDLSAAVSPLSQYRAMFADERVEDVLFTVDPAANLPERIRIATLDDYDGESFRAGGSASVEAGRFVRVPWTLEPGEGIPVDLQIRIEGLRDIWMPTAGRLSSVDFGGPRATELSDGFYYSEAAAAGVQVAADGLIAGDSYRVRGVEPWPASLEDAEPPGGATGDVTPPESLRTWVQEHATGSDGAALAGLVSLLRERGYLSHGLDGAQDALPAWATVLSEYRFQPSASGHSLGRIDTLFARLLERETDPRAAVTSNYVAAVGDDEQFAVAVALVARELGFPSRVVVGVRLASADDGVTVCEKGVCLASDVSAWTEVLTADGDWIPIDATPQYAQSPSLDIVQQRDPENVTEVRPDTVEEILPPSPVQQDSAQTERPADVGLDLSWLGPVLRIAAMAALVLLLALGPFIVIVVAKTGRRRTRRGAATPVARIAGGWDEYVDAAVDSGHAAPRAATRTEAARAFATPEGERLALDADRAVFGGPDGVTDAEAVEFWDRVDRERRALVAENGFWRRAAATVSLKSIVHHIAPAPGGRTRFSERGRRRAAEPVRATS